MTDTRRNQVLKWLSLGVFALGVVMMITSLIIMIGTRNLFWPAGISTIVVGWLGLSLSYWCQRARDAEQLVEEKRERIRFLWQTYGPRSDQA
ncbi:hypothetical protein ACFPPE_07425 [Agromyces tardus]|uniref:hypothetical protein n=1 Tax=Agromyces tardus TaxID=2583849 RepID=UPI003615CE06